jgi:activator of HSP90 ATPase
MKSFKNYYNISAPPEEVYIALTNPNTIMLWSGEEAKMNTEVDSEFSLWNGSIVGKNLEFIEGKKIVQLWYFGDQEDLSIVTMLLHPAKQGTSIELTHTNIPDIDFNEIVEGWNNSYFGSLRKFYEE